MEILLDGLSYLACIFMAFGLIMRVAPKRDRNKKQDY